MTLIIIFIFGLIVGSFLNAVIFRLHSGESVLVGRSHCVHCKHELAAMDLIPVASFLFLSGKCRYCGKKISWQYLIVELVTALSFVLIFINFQFQISNFEFIADLVFFCFLIVIGVFDFIHYLILDKVIFPALVLALVWNIFLGKNYFISGLGGALLVAGFFALQYEISNGRWIGLGDVKFGLFLGVLLGMRLSVVMLLLAYFIGAIVGVSLVLAGKKTFSSKLPFGVFLSFSAMLTILAGKGLADWYAKLLGFNT